jgi:RNA polymerase sigma factor for flagellar operon FliA
MRMTRAAADHAERDRLVMAHVGMVKAAAHRLAQRLPSHVEINDLISIGVVGLINAAGRYRPSMGVPFDAFARRRVQGAMLDALRDLDWAPRSLRKMRRELDAALARLRHELRREPSEEEIAAALDLTPAAYDRALEQLRTLEIGAIRPLDDVSAEGGSLLDVCFDPDEGPEIALQRAELCEHLARAIQQLPERERQILAMYYQEEMTLAEIGAVIGVGESRVSQLRSLVISRLRGALVESLAGVARPAAGGQRLPCNSVATMSHASSGAPGSGSKSGFGRTASAAAHASSGAPPSQRFRPGSWV